jgi:hypothetical protein
VDVQGGIVRIKKDGAIAKSSFRASFGPTNDGMNLMGNNYISHSEQRPDGWEIQSIAYADYMHTMSRFSIKKAVHTTDSGNVIRAGGFVEAGNQNGKVYTMAGVTVGKIDSDGRGSEYGIGA